MRPTMTRRQVLRATGGAAVGLTGVLALAACGETEPTVITKEVPVETTVIKEVPVETIVTRTEVKEVPVDRIVTQEKIVTRDVPVEKIVIKEVPVEKIVMQTVVKEVPVEKIVERIVEVEVQPQRPPVRIRFGHDHVSGVRGAQMKWALDRFAQLRPDINVELPPQSGRYVRHLWDPHGRRNPRGYRSHAWALSAPLRRIGRVHVDERSAQAASGLGP